MKSPLRGRVPGFVAVILTLIFTAHVRSGHEAGIYPSYYPQEIKIEVVAPDGAPPLMSKGVLHAYVGRSLATSSADRNIGVAESFGGYVVAETDYSGIEEPGRACMPLETSSIVMPDDSVWHPYPVTRFHADYRHHFDIASRLAVKPATAPKEGENPAVKIRHVSIADLLQDERRNLNGSSDPPWIRAGWYHAYRLLAGALTDPAQRHRVDDIVGKLRNEFQLSLTERIQLERDLVRLLTSQCRIAVLGYRVLREPYVTEYYAGVENVAQDSIAGLNSEIFIRTVKLKDFPWNGWLTIGVESPAASAWNPVAGFSDPTGRLMWHALSDAAYMALPQGGGWMGNRISGAETTPRRPAR